MFTPVQFIPGLLFLIWLGVIVYVIVLATRLVNAVEQIATALTQRPPAPPAL